MAEKSIYLHDGCTSFVAMHVSSDITEVEAQKVFILRESAPDKELRPLTFGSELCVGTSLVCLDSILYGIGGTKIVDYLREPINDVNVFNPEQLEHKCHQSFHPYLPSLEEERWFAMVEAVGGKIYAFGGLSRSKETSGGGVWAEYLDPYIPVPEWKSLAEPPFRIIAKNKPFSMQLGDGKIYIGHRDITKEGMIYDINKESWEKYKLNTGSLKKLIVPRHPVFVENHNTMYWIVREWLNAFDLNTGVHYSSAVGGVLANLDPMIEYSNMGPILMHLKDDLFCIFTVYKERSSGHGVVECTKFHVAKGTSQDGYGNLKISILGYQSSKCEPMWRLSWAVPIVKSRDDSNTKKRHAEPEDSDDSVGKRYGPCSAVVWRKDF